VEVRRSSALNRVAALHIAVCIARFEHCVHASLLDEFATAEKNRRNE
jgi:hypothetical protein